MTRKVAFIGIGQMGAKMAKRLNDLGFDVLGYDVSPASRESARAMGIETTDDLRKALSDRSIILSSLPNPAIVREAWLGAGGVLEHAQPASLVIELSTIDPGTMQEVAEAARKKGLKVVDAPVSGGPDECAAGTLVIMVGGNQEDIAEGEDVLKALSASYHRTGDVGTAKTVKLINNMMSMGNVVIAAEAFSLGTAAGVEPKVLFDVLSQSGGRSHHFLKRFPKALAGDFSPGFKLELGEKDVALGIELGRMLNKPTPASSVVRELMAIGLASGHRGQDVVAMLDYYDHLNKSK